MVRWLPLLFFLVFPVYGESRLGGKVTPDGREIQCDLPDFLQVKNRGGSDGAGLCVFASAKHSFLWAHVESHERIFEYMFSRPGGGWPEKLKKVIEDISREKGKPVPRFLNYEGKDLTVLREALTAGYMPGITYKFSPTGRYRGDISHMVNLVHLDDRWAGILDNNFPGVIEWMDVGTFYQVFTARGGNGWAFIVISPGPPPIPHNP